MFVFYDVDIWFLGLWFDIFDVVLDDDLFYVVFDVYFCVFVMVLFIGE